MKNKLTPMKPATRRRIMEAFHHLLERTFGNAPRDVQAAERRLRSGLRNKKVDPWEGLLTGAALGLFDRLEADLKGRPEPTPRQLEKFLAGLEQDDLTSMVRSFFHAGLRKLPPVAPGKQPTFKEDKAAKVCAEVERDVARTGLPRKQIYGKFAKKYNIHSRTIQNYCRKTQKRTE